MITESIPGRVKVLRESVARRIAAGEVIDRPFSVVRELLDNAIDAGATEITVEIEGGGIQVIRVIDNGCGMVPEDLSLAILPHATSKISEVEDLSRLHTLGFRGEALPSIAACSKLRIQSRTASAEDAAQIIVHGGTVIAKESTSGKKGTIIEVEDLFYSVPARRKFLKRPSAETTQCKNIFLEKAAAFPEITFRLFVDKQLQLFLPESSLEMRLVNLYKKQLRKDLMFNAEKDFDSHKITIHAGTPAVYRRDRKMIQIFVNHRRINEYALQQAVDYGFSEYLPGGNFPIGFVYITIDPGEVDFNIHPAKREVKFRHINSIHKSIVSLLKGTLQNYALNTKARNRQFIGDNQRELLLSKSKPFPELSTTDFDDQRSTDVSTPNRKTVPSLEREDIPPWQKSTTSQTKANPAKTYAAKRSEHAVLHSYERSTGMQAPTKKPARPVSLPPVTEKQPRPVITPSKAEFTYKGQLFNLFIMVEKDNQLYLIDQHAAHERILYEKFSSDSKYLIKQELIFPFDFQLEKEDGDLLDQQKTELESLGIILIRQDNHRWQITHLPELCLESSDEISGYLQESRGSINDLKQKLFATMSCKEAIKDGAVLDRLTAEDLAAKVFKLNNARCPHGRPIWFSLSRDELFQLIGRTV